MSHFTVLVIGDDVEKQLAPYHEFECTGTDDEFVQSIDITKDVLKEAETSSLTEALEYYGLTNRQISDISRLDLTARHKYGYAIVKNGRLIQAINRTNQQAKWDWYVIGGRWSGYFKLKPGKDGELGEPGVFNNEADEGTADCLRKGDIDFEGMRNAAAREAGLRWAAVRRVITDAINHKEIKFHKSWESVRGNTNKLNDEQLDAARMAYQDQSTVKAIKAASKSIGYVDDLDTILTQTRAQYEQAARDSAVTTFALVKDGKWYERGEMGWWACVAGEKDANKWNAEYAALIDSVPDDTKFTLVDCHI